ncbi:hypothetical protein MMG00_04815 [Ignatzschineria rhizosphaerae]|uniref:Lipoprotein n=1 Tax=Ignatzschineria rhizosphaerae TaxID=2923279 RepID=A0ABY3X4I1_9GAMM|nr:hypothetical protein [Ignatzschineria rhizosphaerae]UNM97175.1 hypothetical protein MMG00_04815 [Ignatzschineria rhizosphaerae]
MKSYKIAISLTALMIAGCSTDGSSSYINALTKFSNILEGTTPLVQESKEWEQYSLDLTKTGVTYSAATSSEKKFATQKLEREYPAAIDRLSRPFALNDNAKKELEAANQNYHFNYHQIMTVKAKNDGKTVGYCINYDVNRWENGKPTPLDTAGNVQQHFIYLAQNKPLSATTTNLDFIKRVCGNSFYQKYKAPNA